jgi:sigma-54 dependent transcriptional regulator, acetoin dehydrogenase operon transcriptional activator AcoR
MASMGPSNHVSRVLSVANPSADTDAQSRIAESWRRCLIDHKLDPSRNGPPQTFTEPELKRLTQPIEQLVQAAIPELEDLARVLRDSGYCVNFADANGTMLISRLPGGDYERMFRDLNIYTGSNFAEACEGTNGVGTALAEQRPILVHRDEHFREQWSIFTCGVAPLFDHVGKLAGAVNITSCRVDLDRAAHQLAFAMALETARRIESSIFRREFGSSWIATLQGDEGAGWLPLMKTVASSVRAAVAARFWG